MNSIGGYNPGDKIGLHGVVVKPNEDYDKLVLVDANQNNKFDEGEGYLRVKSTQDTADISKMATASAIGALEGAFAGLGAGVGSILGASAGKVVPILGVKGGMILGGVALGAAALTLAESTRESAKAHGAGDETAAHVLGGVVGLGISGLAARTLAIDVLSSSLLGARPAGIVGATTLAGAALGSIIGGVNGSSILESDGIPDTVAPHPSSIKK